MLNAGALARLGAALLVIVPLWLAVAWAIG
jgi:hypothetical protein